MEDGDARVRVSGPDFIDVPAHTERAYRLSFFTYVEGVTAGTLTFLNESTGEYLYYEFRFTSLSPEDISELTLEIPVRQLASEVVEIENPLDVPVSFAGSCAHDQVSVPATTTLEPGRRGRIEVSYRPLLVGEDEARVSFTCRELGLYKYRLRMRGTPPPLDNSISFSVSLGGRQVLPFRFTHWLDAKAEYSCRFASEDEDTAAIPGDGACFGVEAPNLVAYAGGQEGMEQEVEVAFEPERLGESFRNTLVVSSPTGGEYRCVVLGRCVQPQPQGPLEIRGGSGAVSFKNVFSKETTFSLSVDNPSFSVSDAEKIAAKHSKSIAISYRAAAGSGDAQSRNCRLIISCADTPHPWVYYITAAK